MIAIELTKQQAYSMLNLLVEAKDRAEMEILKDRRRANHSAHNRIELTENVVPRLRKALTNFEELKGQVGENEIERGGDAELVR